MYVDALASLRAVVRPLESIAADEGSRRCASDEPRSVARRREHDVHVDGGRESRHASPVKRASLELVLDDEDAVGGRARCPLHAERSAGAAPE